jgi:cytochrome b
MPRQISFGDASLSDNRARLSDERARVQPVWDLPVRLVHWLLAMLITFSWWSVHNNHTDWHIWSGIAILTLLVFRLLWGFLGSSTARWSSFVRGPRTVADYLRGRWTGVGHTPLGGWSVAALFAALSIQVGLGLFAEDEDGLYLGPLSRFLDSETSDRIRDIHELWFNVVLAVVVLHIAAIIFYRVRGRTLTKPMITGKAELAPGEEPMRPGKWWVAIICLAVAFAFARWILAGAPPLGT